MKSKIAFRTMMGLLALRKEAQRAQLTKIMRLNMIKTQFLIKLEIKKAIVFTFLVRILLNKYFDY